MQPVDWLTSALKCFWGVKLISMKLFKFEMYSGFFVLLWNLEEVSFIVQEKWYHIQANLTQADRY